MQDKQILVIDDDPNLLELLTYIFSRTEVQLHTAANGPQGLRKFFQSQPDLVILDLMMPDMDGWEVCRQIRQLSDAPLIMLTALNQDDKMIQGLACGADDYITKPFNPQVLLARVQALLRRTEPDSPPEKKLPDYNDDYLLIDLNKRIVRVQGQLVKLGAKEYDLLIYMLKHAGRVLTFEQILTNIWGDEYRDNAQYVHAYIWRLRRKLEADPHAPVYLQTEHGIGYRFEKQAGG